MSDIPFDTFDVEFLLVDRPGVQRQARHQRAHRAAEDSRNRRGNVKEVKSSSVLLQNSALFTNMIMCLSRIYLSAYI